MTQGSLPHSRKRNSRRFRKGLREWEAGREIAVRQLWHCLWAPGDLNWWIGSLFAVGSLHFAVASVLALLPGVARAWSVSETGTNAVYFVGSLFFTTAAYLQLYQSAGALQSVFRASQADPRRHALFGWYPFDVGWLSCALQFVGTVLFNVSTFDAMIPSLSWQKQDLLIWVPDLIGSVLFLASGYLAFVETCGTHWAWRPGSISWWVTSCNLAGCVGFMTAALLAVILPGPTTFEAGILAPAFTLLGAIGFFVGSCLMLPEATSGQA